MSKKININVPEELLSRLDDEAALQHMTRTAYILRAVQQCIEADTFLRVQPDIKRKLLDIQNDLQSVAAMSDKDFAGVFGQESMKL